MAWFKKCGFKDDTVEPNSSPSINVVDVLSKKEKTYTVKVNNKLTDLALDDVIFVGPPNNKYAITIGGIMISPNGKVSYLCESNCGGEIKAELMTLGEIKRLCLRSLV